MNGKTNTLSKLSGLIRNKTLGKNSAVTKTKRVDIMVCMLSNKKTLFSRAGIHNNKNGFNNLAI